MLIRDVALRTCRKQWTIGRGGKRGSGISVLIARHHDDDEPSNGHRRHQTVWEKCKGIRNFQQDPITYSQGIAMKFGIEKCAMLIKRNEKWQMTEGIKLPNQEKIGTLKKGNLLVPGNIGSEHHSTSGDGRKSWFFFNISGVRENYSKLNYWAEISSKG